MKSETAVKEEIAKRLRALQRAGRPLWYIKIHGHQMQRVGCPDFLICDHGRFLALELKAPEGRHPVTPSQAREMQQICDARGQVLVASSWSEVSVWLDSLSL